MTATKFFLLSGWRQTRWRTEAKIYIYIRKILTAQGQTQEKQSCLRLDHRKDKFSFATQQAEE
jgi:hypothetical protein